MQGGQSKPRDDTETHSDHFGCLIIGNKTLAMGQHARGAKSAPRNDTGQSLWMFIKVINTKPKAKGKNACGVGAAIVPEGIPGVVELLHIVNTHGHEGLGVESFSF